MNKIDFETARKFVQQTGPHSPEFEKIEMEFNPFGIETNLISGIEFENGIGIEGEKYDAIILETTLRNRCGIGSEGQIDQSILGLDGKTIRTKRIYLALESREKDERPVARGEGIEVICRVDISHEQLRGELLNAHETGYFGLVRDYYKHHNP